MKILLIDERMRLIEKNKLRELGYELIEIKKSNNVYEEISSHVDIFACKIKEKVIVEKSKFKDISNKIKKDILIEGNKKVKSKYPEDIIYNVCTIGNKAIHNFKFTDLEVLRELKRQKFELIQVNQGYSNCSIAVIDENMAITSDKGIYNELEKNNINTLFLDYLPDIKLMFKNTFSDKFGFIGGAISRIKNKIIVFGDLNKIDKENKIRKFIKSRNLDIIDFKGLDVIDYGGIIEINL